MEDWIIGMMLALFVIVPCWLALARKKETIRQVEAWPELAERTGLTFNPNVFNSPLRDYHRPGLRGAYRGRSLAVDLFIHGNPDRMDAFIYQNTSISLDVENHGLFSFSIQAEHIREDTHAKLGISSGNRDFDKHYSSTGSPREYVQGALDLIARSDPRLLTWILHNSPSIELKGDQLLYDQNSELTNVDDQIALLNLLCDLAELTEGMGSKICKFSYKEGGTDMKTQEPLQDLQPKNPPVAAAVISLQPKKSNRYLPILFIGVTVGALCICLIVGGSWLFLIQRGVAEVRTMGPWPDSDVPPEALVKVDLSHLGLEAGRLQNARDEETWAEGQYETGTFIAYESKSEEVVSIWALRYVDREIAAEDFMSVQVFAEQTCPMNIWAQLLATGIIHCSFSDAHIKVLWNDHWIVNIMALDGTGIAPDILLDQVCDAISAHWKSIAQPAY